jgi:hypothetical protein
MKKMISVLIEWARPFGIVFVYFAADSCGADAVLKFHIMGLFTVIIMCGTVAFESLLLGEAASEKIGYLPNRAYQIQSGLANLAMALTAVIVFMMNWGVYADVTIVTVMLLFFTFSAINHAITAVKERNFKLVNLMRPFMTLLLLGILLPLMIKVLLR